MPSHGAGRRARCGARQPSLWLLLLASSGCSFLIDVGEDQCVKDSDCESAGLDGSCQQGVCVALEEEPACDGGACATRDAAEPEVSDPDSCFGSMRCDGGKICWKDQCVFERDVERFVCDPPPGEEVERVRFEMPVIDFVTQQPPTDLAVRACRVNDIACADPQGSFEDEDGTGLIALDLPYRFAGFLEVTSSSALPALWYFTKPLTRPTMAKPLRVVSPDTVESLAGATGLQPQGSTGLAILEAFDCSNASVGGIHFVEDKGQARPFFIVDGQPNTTSQVTVVNELTNDAPGGFLNVAPGFTQFTARIGVDGPMLGEFNANVRASTVTYLDIHP